MPPDQTRGHAPGLDHGRCAPRPVRPCDALPAPGAVALPGLRDTPGRIQLRNGPACRLEAVRYPGFKLHTLVRHTTSERTRAAVAQKIQTLLIDDLDGSAAEGTVRFGLDGTEYEIDLNAGHARELRDALARYVDAARRVSGSARMPARGSRRGPAGGLDTTEVREWARAQGIEVKDRGRVPADLVAKFKAATGQQG